MKKLTILIAALIVLIPSLAHADMLTFRLGYYMPNAVMTNSYLASHPNTLWGIELTQMSLLRSDYKGAILGGGYEFFLTPQISLALSVDFFSRENGGYYWDYVANTVDDVDYAFPAQDFRGRDILHTFRVSMTPVQLSFKFAPLGRKARIIPYVGAGGGAYFVSASIYGSIVDFSQEFIYTDPVLGDVTVYEVKGAHLHETRVVLGGHAFAGFMFPIGYRLTLEGEARYHFAKVTFNDAFQGYDKFDLSGLSLSVGFNYWF
jgi:hypothetical protein